MIRRRGDNEFRIIAQIDHARLAWELAGHFGNDEFDRPADGVIEATAHHDDGWPMHDELPTVNERGEPLDLFETPRSIALPIWRASADWAEKLGAYQGLLVSLHSLNLSTMPPTQAPTTRDQFDLNKFQHHEIERQERLRRQLQMRTDLPLHFGLAKEGIDEREDQLRFDYRVLRAMDVFSLGICCDEPPTDRCEVHARVGGRILELQLRREGDDLLVTPWPFDVERITVKVPYRAVEARAFEVEEFREMFREASVREMTVTIAQEFPR